MAISPLTSVNGHPFLVRRLRSEATPEQILSDPGHCQARVAVVEAFTITRLDSATSAGSRQGSEQIPTTLLRSVFV